MKETIQNITLKDIGDKDVLMALSKLAITINDIWAMFRIRHLKRKIPKEDDYKRLE